MTLLLLSWHRVRARRVWSVTRLSHTYYQPLSALFMCAMRIRQHVPRNIFIDNRGTGLETGHIFTPHHRYVVSALIIAPISYSHTSFPTLAWSLSSEAHCFVPSQLVFFSASFCAKVYLLWCWQTRVFCHLRQLGCVPLIKAIGIKFSLSVMVM